MIPDTELILEWKPWLGEGLTDQVVNWAFKDRGKAYDFFKGVFFSENMINLSKRYMKDGKNGDANSNNEQLEDGQLQSMAQANAAKLSADRAIVLTPRLLNTKDSAAKYTFNKTSIKDPGDNRIENEFVPITQNNAYLKKYFESGLLNTVYDMNIPQQKHAMAINTKDFGVVKCNAIERPYKNGVSYDMPFLRPDASLLLKRILEEFTYQMSKDKYGEDNKKTVIFKMGTRCGENTWASTGYLFRIEIPGYDKTEKILEELKKEYKNLYISEYKDVQYGVFEYKKTISKDSKSEIFDIFVSPKNEYITSGINDEE